MTTYNKASLKPFFAENAVPQGQDYANFIDSYVNLVETVQQSMAGSLATTELVTPKVSATNVNVTGTLTAPGIKFTNVSAARVSAPNVLAVTLSANNGYITTLFQPVGIVSAAGTTQATGALASFAITRVQGVGDGQATGIVLASSKAGWQQVIMNETGTSANLWPTVGGTINGLGANAAFAMAGTTGYRIAHLTANTYAVK